MLGVSVCSTNFTAVQTINLAFYAICVVVFIQGIVLASPNAPCYRGCAVYCSLHCSMWTMSDEWNAETSGI